MAWLSSNSFVAGNAMSHAYLNNLANDIRAWGGDVNGGGYALSNVTGLTGVSSKFGVGTASPQAAVDIYGGGTLWQNGNTLYQVFATADRIVQVRSATQAVINLVSDINTADGAVGGVYFSRSAGQGDAHIQIAGIRGVQNGTGVTAGGGLAIYTKLSVIAESARFTPTGLGIGMTPLLALDVAGQIRSLVNSQDLRMNADVGSIAAFGTYSNHGIIFIVNSGEAMRFSANRNLAINKPGGTNSKLAVAGLVAYATNALAISGGLSAGDFYIAPGGAGISVVGVVI